MSAPPSNSLLTFIKQSQSRVESRLESVLDNVTSTENLSDAMKYTCLAGGKRIRPILVYATCDALGVELSKADNAACAVELVHCYSLAHDDLPSMDDDDVRRGKPSLHIAFDEATAILTGDALQSMAFELLAQESTVSVTNRIRMVNELAQAIGANGMVAGQDLDFSASGKHLNESQLANLHNRKTGALIQASLRLGALCKEEVEASVLETLKEFGEAVGLAFQVQDDILDVTENTESLGKPQGSDALKAKPTYVSILGLDAARARATELTEQAHSILDSLEFDVSLLRELASYITQRKH